MESAHGSKKPDLQILTVWRIRLLLVALVPSFFSAFFAPRINWVWWLFTAAWMAAFLYFYIFYYPIKYRKLSYGFNRRCLLIHCGVIYTRVKGGSLNKHPVRDRRLLPARAALRGLLPLCLCGGQLGLHPRPAAGGRRPPASLPHPRRRGRRPPRCVRPPPSRPSLFDADLSLPLPLPPDHPAGARVPLRADGRPAFVDFGRVDGHPDRSADLPARLEKVGLFQILYG